MSVSLSLLELASRCQNSDFLKLTFSKHPRYHWEGAEIYEQIMTWSPCTELFLQRWQKEGGQRTSFVRNVLGFDFDLLKHWQTQRPQLLTTPEQNSRFFSSAMLVLQTEPEEIADTFFDALSLSVTPAEFAQLSTYLKKCPAYFEQLVCVLPRTRKSFGRRSQIK